MSLKTWAVKVGQLKPLSRAGLLLFGARCVLRVAPWRPPHAVELWSDGLEHVVGNAFADPLAPESVRSLEIAISDAGVEASETLGETDEVLGTCANYAACTLSAAVDATGIADDRALRKRIVEVAKQSASIPAVLAHGGRVQVADGDDPVDVACLAVWALIRADVELIAGALESLERATDRVDALAQLAPPWGAVEPRWIAGNTID